MIRKILTIAAGAVLMLAPADAALRHAGPRGTAAPAPKLVELSPVPGVTLSVPGHWNGCDALSDMRLGSKPSEVQNVACRYAQPGSAFEVYDDEDLHQATLRLTRTDEKPYFEKLAAESTPESLALIRGDLCREVTKSRAAAGFMIDSCDIAIGALAGHRALVFAFVSRAPGLAAADANRVYSRDYEFAYGHGFLSLWMQTPLDCKPVTIPALETILASLKAE